MRIDDTRLKPATAISSTPAPEPATLGPTSIVEARKLEHQYPHALKVKYRGS